MPRVVRAPFQDIEAQLSLELVRVVEAAALASARTMGQGDRDGSDRGRTGL